MMAGPGLHLMGDEEERRVIHALRTKRLSRYRFDADIDKSPSYVYQFERQMETLIGSTHCIGTNSCTTALLSAMLAAGIGPGDEVIVPGYTFIATVAAIAYAGAIPVLAEIDASLTLDPEDVERRIGARTKAICAVHMLGAPCDMDALRRIADAHGLMLFEDVAQAGGGSYAGRALGSWGLAGAFSLNVFKTFTAGDGGALVTSDKGLYERAFAIHDHGAAPLRFGVADADGFLGLNFRMHELTGAVASAQVEKVPEILSATRGRKIRLSGSIGELPGVRRRTVHDTAGDCGTTLVYVFDDEAIAVRTARRLGTKVLSESRKHNCLAVPQLREFRLPRVALHLRPAAEAFIEGSLPRTDWILRRAVALSVGVVDTYLGTGYGINVQSEDDEILAVAEHFRRAVLDGDGQ